MHPLIMPRRVIIRNCTTDLKGQRLIAQGNALGDNQ